MTNFYELLNGLRTEDQEKKKSLTRELSAMLSSDDKLMQSILHPLLVSTLPSIVDESYHGIVRSPFYRENISTYVDTDELTKIRISLIYLQDFTDPVEYLDKEVLKELEALLRLRGLEELVNDIVVNFIHSRNGEVITLL